MLMPPPPSPSARSPSSPSPRAAHCSLPSSSAPYGWHYPGPSSRFTKRERSKSSYSAPHLSTQRRSHRRVQSTAAPTTPTTTANVPPSPSRQHRPTPLSRFPSYTSPAMAVPSEMRASVEPSTPAKSITSSRPTSSMLHDSPFSDYFSNDGASRTAGAYALPPPETQQLLVRLNKLQAQLMRGETGSGRETLNIVGRKFSEIERDLNSLHSQTRMPAEMEDSGLFMDEADEREEDEEGTPNGLGVFSPPVSHSQACYSDSPVTPENKQAENDFLILQAQQALENVMKAQELLRQRHAELRKIADDSLEHIEEQDKRIEEQEQQVEELRSRSEALESDLGFDHSELLFMNLQFKALEVELDTKGPTGSGNGVKDGKSARIGEWLQRWRVDWDDVNRRMNQRRSKHGVVSPEDTMDHSPEKELEDSRDNGGDWRLETVKRVHGKVQSITIRRVKLQGADGDDAGERSESRQPDEEEPAAEPEGHETAPLAGPKSTPYTSSATQTMSTPLSWFFSQRSDASPDARETRNEYDCAITTSSEENSSCDDDDDDDNTPKRRKALGSPVKTAWQDLWEGLSNLAGMGEDRF